MKHSRSRNGCLCACALALALGGCGSIEHRPASSSVPEPPPWNSIEMMWLETEIVRVDSPGGEPLAGHVPAALG
jgi:hypothetical protein